jgi:hypothetical protein
MKTYDSLISELHEAVRQAKVQAEPITIKPWNTR